MTGSQYTTELSKIIIVLKKIARWHNRRTVSERQGDKRNVNSRKCAIQYRKGWNQMCKSKLRHKSTDRVNNQIERERNCNFMT